MWTIYFISESYQKAICVFACHSDALYYYDFLQDSFVFIKDNLFLCKEDHDSLKEIFK